jgi:Domain of unknown function (DUF4342)
MVYLMCILVSIVKEHIMETDTRLEQVKAEGSQLVERIKWLIHEGNVRRIIITQNDGEVVAEFPLTVGVIGTLLAPVFAAIGAMVALLAECRIYVECSEPTKAEEPTPIASAEQPKDPELVSMH